MRCEWCVGDELYERYHDEEWGVPVYDDRILFEFLTLEGAQAGLSWITILKRREGYRQAFDDYDLSKIVAYSEGDLIELKENPAIIRNKLKINSVVKNAAAVLKIKEEFGSFSQYLWGFVDNQPINNKCQTRDDVPVETEVSKALSKDLKKRGCSFVGPTIMYAFMQAVGMVNDHVKGCKCYKEE